MITIIDLIDNKIGPYQDEIQSQATRNISRHRPAAKHLPRVQLHSRSVEFHGPGIGRPRKGEQAL